MISDLEKRPIGCMEEHRLKVDMMENRYSSFFV